MACNLNNIIREINKDVEGFIRACDDKYQSKVVFAADEICENLEKSPIVLLSGPSGSGKTTTALKVSDELKARGIKTYTVSLDNYFRTVDPKTAPRTKSGDIDYESPLCIDAELLREHFVKLGNFEEIMVPYFSFTAQQRVTSKFFPIHIQKNEVVVFEGIHALNDEITDAHTSAYKLYVSARSDILNENEKVCFKGTWARLVRRVVRDRNFRGTKSDLTLSMWANIRRGEKKYISPYKNKANYLLDSLLPYELPVFKNYAADIFSNIPENIERQSELLEILPAFDAFPAIDPKLVPPKSLLREFIGGGTYKY